MKRRRFLATTLGAAGMGASAEFAERKGPARLPIGLAAYSFRSRFRWMKGRPQEPQGDAMDMFSFIDFCAEQGCAGTELTSYFFEGEASDAYLVRLKRHAFLRGIDVCGTAIGNDFSHGKGAVLDAEVATAKRWLDKAAVLGAPHVRFFAGTSKGFAGGKERVAAAVEALRDCAEYAGKRGIMIGVENHGAISAEFLLELLKKVDSPWLGINLDSGNFVSDDPYGDFARCAPWAANVQMKTHMKGGVEADLSRLMGLLKKARYQGYVVLEYERGKPAEEIPGYLRTLQKLTND